MAVEWLDDRRWLGGEEQGFTGALVRDKEGNQHQICKSISGFHFREYLLAITILLQSYVPAHSGDYGNECADILAKLGAVEP